MVILLIYIYQIWVFFFSSVSEHVWDYTTLKDSPNI